jgi:hypothetical protein
MNGLQINGFLAFPKYACKLECVLTNLSMLEELNTSFSSSLLPAELEMDVLLFFTKFLILLILPLIAITVVL